MSTGELLVALNEWLESHRSVDGVESLYDERLSKTTLYEHIREILERRDSSIEQVLQVIASAINDNATECVADAHYKANP